MPSHLRFAGLQQRTLRAYRVGLERFLSFARCQGYRLRTVHQLDVAVGEYLNALFQEGDSIAQGGHLLSGLKRFQPHLRLTLPVATQFYKNWQRIHRPERAVPISWDLLQALSAVCFTLQRPAVALMLYVGYFCFLRRSEMLAMQVFHLVLHQRKPQITVVIPFAKTSNGNPQVVVFEDARVHRLAMEVQDALERDAFLWPGSPGSFRTFWLLLMGVVGFGPTDYSPYGIRRGGATTHFLDTGSMDITLHRGRWTCNKTAEQYIDDGTLAMARFFWTPRQTSRVRKWALKGAKVLKRLRQRAKKWT